MSQRMGYIWPDLYLTTDLSSAKCLVLLPKCLPDLYSVPKSFPYAELLHRAIICNKIRFYLMYKSLYNRNIYLQILTMQNNLIPDTGWISEFKYFQILANNQICVPDPCLNADSQNRLRAPQSASSLVPIHSRQCTGKMLGNFLMCTEHYLECLVHSCSNCFMFPLLPICPPYDQLHTFQSAAT
jgi:hypothetical protein